MKEKTRNHDLDRLIINPLDEWRKCVLVWNLVANRKLHKNLRVKDIEHSHYKNSSEQHLTKRLVYGNSSKSPSVKQNGCLAILITRKNVNCTFIFLKCSTFKQID